MPHTDDLLLLRLEALELDIKKVRAALDTATQRGQLLDDALAELLPVKGALSAVSLSLQGLTIAIEDDRDIAKLIGEATDGLDKQLLEAPDKLTRVIEAVSCAQTKLKHAKATTVTLETEKLLDRLKNSLEKRCNTLDGKLKELRLEVETKPAQQRREQWLAYQNLLDDVVRPVFMEYVDFLGGLTVRDPGLDDQVCEMTTALLSRFAGVTDRALPLPARQAALGSALDSVVFLGFPEWSIWGIPLAMHELGLAYAQNPDDDVLARLVERFREHAPSPKPGSGEAVDEKVALAQSRLYVQQLLADAFAAYTLGYAYACAALLLRLSPRHDEPPEPDRPRDIDRARVIMMTLQARDDVQAGGSLSEAVADLQRIWDEGVRAHAGPESAAEAVSEAQGPAPAHDWLDDLTAAAVAHFRDLRTIRPFDAARWRGSDAWLSWLSGQAGVPPWTPTDDTVLDVLTAAWRFRLLADERPAEVAASIKTSWAEWSRGV